MEPIDYLDPNKITFTRTKGELLSVRIGAEIYPEVLIYRTFPRKYPFQYLSVCDKNNKELGIIFDLTELDDESEQEVRRELKVRYLIPKVIKILSVKQEPGSWILKFLTDRGEVEFFIRNVHDHIKMSESGRVMIKEDESRQVYIERFSELDKRSSRLFNKIL